MTLDQRRYALQQQIAELEPEAPQSVEGFVASLGTEHPNLSPWQVSELTRRTAIATETNAPTLSPEQVHEYARNAWFQSQAAKG